MPGRRSPAVASSGMRAATRKTPAKKRNWLGIVVMVVGIIIILFVVGGYFLKNWMTDKAESILAEKGRMSLQNRPNYTKYKAYYDKQEEKFHKEAFQDSLTEAKKGTITGNMDLFYVRALARKIAAQAAKDGEKDVEEKMKALSASIDTQLGIP